MDRLSKPSKEQVRERLNEGIAQEAKEYRSIEAILAWKDKANARYRLIV